MVNDILNSILKEYDQKKLKAELDLEERKTKLYKSVPRLEEIEKELNYCSINIAKNILNNNTSKNDFQKKIELLKKERINLLNEHNLTLDFLKPHYSCEFCKDTGYIIRMGQKTEMCQCLKQKLLNASYDNSNISNVNKENFTNFNDELFSDNVDLSKYKFNISPRKNIQNIKKKCIDFIENFDNINSKNLLFTGNTGLRKNFYV